jgi:flagellar biosynthesis protein FlhG
MVRRATKSQRGGQENGARKGSRGALGPGGRGLFARFFGGPAPAVAGAAPRQEAVSIAIASGKGGTGKSFFATNLAIVLRQQLGRVTLVDCDFGLACTHLLLGVKPKQTLQHLLAGNAILDDIRVPTSAGPMLVPGASGVMKMADLDDRQLLLLGGMFGELAAEEDCILFDVGAGIAPQNILTLLAADHVILVTQPEIAALTDAYAVIKCCVQRCEQTKFSVVVNRVTESGHGEATFEKLAGVAQRHVGIALAYLGEIREDPQITQRRLNQQPVVVSDPHGATAVALRVIADRLAAAAGPLGPRKVAGADGLESRFREHRLFLGT